MKFGQNKDSGKESTDTEQTGEEFRQANAQETGDRTNVESQNSDQIDPNVGQRTADDSTDATVLENNTGPSAPNLDQLAKDAGVLSTTGLPRDPTAKEVGFDVEEYLGKDQVGRVLAETAAADAGAASNPSVDEVVYSSHPIQNFAVGPYVFEKSIMRLKADKVAAFEKVLDQLPPQDRRVIRRLDQKAVDDIVQSRSDTVFGVLDSGAGKAALESLKRKTPVMGTQEVGAQMGLDAGPSHDGNDPQTATEPNPDAPNGLDGAPHTPPSE